DDITGNSLMPVRIYHNVIKIGLYDLVKPKSLILDIGSGRGGDVLKWKGLINKGCRFIAVEPSLDNIESLEKRINENKLQNIEILNCGGEDVEKITKAVSKYGKADVITMMLSLTFFWKNE